MDTTRKLAAIFYTDLAGYSRLTGADEEGTHKTLSAYLDLISESIGNHSGQVLHYAGDAILAEFASVISALTCAVDVQRDLATRNENVPDERKLQFRIGINMGDVIVDRDELYGDGVNIAARLESTAEPGGICISGAVYDQVNTKLAFDYVSLGARKLKNIANPVPVYQVWPLAMPRAKADEEETAAMVDSAEPPAYQWTAFISVIIVLLGISVMVWGFYSG